MAKKKQKIKNKPVIFLISGIAGSGKDTFYEITSSLLQDTAKFALADKLKGEVAPRILEAHNVDIHTCSREDKDKVRHELIEFGKEKRRETEGRYFVDLLVPDLLESQAKYKIITDFRYPANEFLGEDDILSEHFTPIIVHISRYKNGRVIPATISEEIIHDPIISAKADYKICWPVVGDGNIHLLKGWVQDFWADFELAGKED